MFEDFTFLSMSSNMPSSASPHSSTSGYTSESVSPHTSRPSSPQSHLKGRDSRYYGNHHYRPSLTSTKTSRDQSVTALTSQFRDYSINSRATAPLPPESPSSPVSPTTTSRHSSSSTSASSFGPPTPPPDYRSPSPPNLSWPTESSDMSMDLDLHHPPLKPLSAPPTHTAAPSYASLPPSLLRRQRQTLVRLQCLAQSAPGLAMLIEECHPSDLPLLSTNPCTSGGGGYGGSGAGSPAGSRRSSLSSVATPASSARVEKRGSGGVGVLTGSGRRETGKGEGRKALRKRGTH